MDHMDAVEGYVFDPVIPVFRCMSIDDSGEYTAWFGYQNPNPYNTYIASSGDNFFINGSLEISVGLPSKFYPGETMYAFSVG